MKTDKLKVGFLTTDGAQSYLVTDLLQRAEASMAYEVTALLVQKTPKSDAHKSMFRKLAYFLRRNSLRSIVQRLFWGAIHRLEAALIKHTSRFHFVFKRTPLDTITVPKIVLEPVVSESGLVHRFTESDLEQIRSLDLDAIVMAGGAILKGEILSVCRFGILSFHHGDNRFYRGGPAAFWEVFERRNSTGFIIQQLTDELDGGRVLCRGSLATSAYYLLNMARLYVKANVFMHRTLECIAKSDGLPDTEISYPYSGRLYKRPSFTAQLNYIWMTYTYLMKKAWRRLIRKEVIWSIGYQKTDSWRNAELYRTKRIENLPDRFFADPIVAQSGGRSFIFAEDFDLKARKGVISAFEINGQQEIFLGTVLSEEFHLSYPYVFEFDGDWYMCPETNETNEIRLYKSFDFPFRWQLATTLVKNVNAFDTTILFHDGKWWLLATVDSSDVGDAFSELNVYYSDELLAGTWKPHAKNPVKFDATVARNAGKISCHNGKLLRPFQIPGFDTYGKASGVAEITKLTPDDYEEVVLVENYPNFFDDAVGTHSFSHDGEILALDFFKFD